MVSSEAAGSALLTYLAARFTYQSGEEWTARIAEGRIAVNGAAAAAATVLAAGDILSFDASAIAEPPVDPTYEVLFEDEGFLIVNKSGSLPCHPGGRFFEHSLWYLLRERFGYCHIATRLDRETSGLVLVCRSPSAARRAQDAHDRGALKKSYLALVHGIFPDLLVTRGYLSKDEGSRVRKKRKYEEKPCPSSTGDSESCETSFELIERRTGDAGDFSLVQAIPRSGRTHQIRATLLSSGFPLVGDKLYGLDEGMFLRHAAGNLDAADAARLLLPGQALHCAELSLEDGAGRAMSARSAPPWISFPGGDRRP